MLLSSLAHQFREHVGDALPEPTPLGRPTGLPSPRCHRHLTVRGGKVRARSLARQVSPLPLVRTRRCGLVIDHARRLPAQRSRLGR